MHFSIQERKMADTKRYRKLSPFWQVIMVIGGILAAFVAVYYLFNLSFFGLIIDIGARYLLIACLLPLAFILRPPVEKPSGHVPWYDTLAAILSFAIPVYFFAHSWEIANTGWQYPTPFNLFLSGVLCLLVLEITRRYAGYIFFFIALTIGAFPLFADKTPGILHGIRFSWERLIASYSFSTAVGFPGLPGQTMLNILIGFLVFAAVLLATGGGNFFLKLATSLMGKYRGGPAKVGVLASGFFGSMSGSALANIVGTGSVTIPAMKRLGYPPHYAGAIEACASCGGYLMPPVMGTAAFVMVQFLNIPYSKIIIYAAIPALLYYLGLWLQVDAYAARTGLARVPKAELPSFWKTMRDGWHFIAAFAFLLWGLLYLRWEAVTPYYSSVLLIVLAMFRKDTRITWKKLVTLLWETSRLLTETSAILFPLAFMVGGLTLTGVATSFTSGLVGVSGGNAYIALLMGTVACVILGMAGMALPAYIFLAISMAPALVNMGFNAVSVHLFIIYIAMLAGITPPVAVVAFVGASIAGAPYMKTSITACRLGVVIYFIPFFFVINPALVMLASPYEVVYSALLATIGVIFIAAGLEAYLYFFGRVEKWWRIPLVLSGLLIMYPAWKINLIGAGTIAITILGMLAARSARKEAASKAA